MKHYTFKLEGMKPISTNDAVEYSKFGVNKSSKYRIFEAEFEIKLAEDPELTKVENFTPNHFDHFLSNSSTFLD